MRPLTEITDIEKWDSTTRTAMQLLRGARDALTIPVDRVYIAPGDEVAWDPSCEGQLYVRIVTSTANRPEHCDGPKTVIYGLGVVRCVATVDDQGVPPSPNRMTQDALVLQTDRRDLECFLTDAVKTTGIMEWSAMGPEGGAALGEWNFGVVVL